MWNLVKIQCFSLRALLKRSVVHWRTLLNLLFCYIARWLRLGNSNLWSRHHWRHFDWAQKLLFKDYNFYLQFLEQGWAIRLVPGSASEKNASLYCNTLYVIFKIFSNWLSETCEYSSVYYGKASGRVKKTATGMVTRKHHKTYHLTKLHFKSFFVS